MTLILTIDPAYDIAEIILRLTKAKLEVTSVIPMLNLITVEASASQMAAIEIISGIIAIETENDIHIRHDQPLGSASIVRRLSGTLLDADLDSGFTAHTIN
jgi:hypothetical protein